MSEEVFEMKVDVNKEEVDCPWPTCKNYANRHNCFGRPRSHLIEEPEHTSAYPESLDTDEAIEQWKDLEVQPQRPQQ